MPGRLRDRTGELASQEGIMTASEPMAALLGIEHRDSLNRNTIRHNQHAFRRVVATMATSTSPSPSDDGQNSGPTRAGWTERTL